MTTSSHSPLRLKILHCVPSLNASDGGPARSVPALAGAVAAAGGDVRVWSRQPPTIDLRNFAPAIFMTQAMGSTRSKGWIPDIIHDHGLWLTSNQLAARFGRRHRIPRIVSPRGMLEPWCLQHKRYKKLLAWALYQHRDLRTSACLHATSESEAKQFRLLGFSQPIVYLPNGVTLPLSEHSSPAKSISSRREREVLFLSRIHPVKGLPNLIKAWKQVSRPGWRLRIVGSDEGGHRGEIQSLIAQSNLQETIRVGDSVHGDEKWALLSDADIVVLPSFSENFGIVVAEALGVGTPVITTTGTPWNELVSKRCGWYVEPSANGLIEALTDAMKLPSNVLHAMGKRGQQWVRRDFSWTDIGEKMLDTYGWLSGQDRQADWILPASRKRAA